LRVMQPLAQHYAAHAAEQDSGDPETASLHADLCALQTLLDGSDLKALEVHARVQLAGPRTGITGFADLEQAVRDFDFARGSVLCARLISALSETDAHIGTQPTAIN
jgi:hypothetical protein